MRSRRIGGRKLYEKRSRYDSVRGKAFIEAYDEDEFDSMEEQRRMDSVEKALKKALTFKKSAVFDDGTQKYWDFDRAYLYDRTLGNEFDTLRVWVETDEYPYIEVVYDASKNVNKYIVTIGFEGEHFECKTESDVVKTILDNLYKTTGYEWEQEVSNDGYDYVGSLFPESYRKSGRRKLSIREK